MSEEVAERIRALIEEQGPITFARFMEEALYGPGGFYERPPVGDRGDFVTSPHVHPVFGAALGRGLREMWHHMGSPEPFRIVEVGAGDGTLAAQVLETLRDVPLEYTAVERSAGARERLAELPIRVAPSLEVIEQDLTGCLVANELLDNLPFRRVRRSGKRIVEVLVGVKRGRFVEVEEPCGEDLRDELPELDLAPGEERQVSVDALYLVDRVAMMLRHGYALFIDYAKADGTHVHGYRGHRVVLDVLEHPGSADVTAGVDFAPLVARAAELGLEVLGPMTQRACLIALGIERYMEDERVRQVRFLQQGAGREAFRTFSGRTRALTLVDPDQLGKLQWLLLATPDRGWPGWAWGASLG